MPRLDVSDRAVLEDLVKRVATRYGRRMDRDLADELLEVLTCGRHGKSPRARWVCCMGAKGGRVRSPEQKKAARGARQAGEERKAAMRLARARRRRPAVAAEAEAVVSVQDPSRAD